MPWGYSNLPPAALSSTAPSCVRRLVSLAQHFQGFQELSLPGCDWVEPKQSLVVVQTGRPAVGHRGRLEPGVTLSQGYSSPSQATACESGEVGFRGGNQEQTSRLLLVEGPIQFSVISSKNFQEIQDCLLASPPRSSFADLIRSLTDPSSRTE